MTRAKDAKAAKKIRTSKFEFRNLLFVFLASWRDNIFCQHGWQHKTLEINFHTSECKILEAEARTKF